MHHNRKYNGYAICIANKIFLEVDEHGQPGLAERAVWFATYPKDTRPLEVARQTYYNTKEQLIDALRGEKEECRKLEREIESNHTDNQRHER